MFVFLLEVIAGEGPTTFFDLPKKRTPTARPCSPVIRQAWVASSPAILPPAASPAPPPPPVALTPTAQLNHLDRPPTLGPPLPPKYQYCYAPRGRKGQTLAGFSCGTILGVFRYLSEALGPLVKYTPRGS